MFPNTESHGQKNRWTLACRSQKGSEGSTAAATVEAAEVEMEDDV